MQNVTERNETNTESILPINSSISIETRKPFYFIQEAMLESKNIFSYYKKKSVAYIPLYLQN